MEKRISGEERKKRDKLQQICFTEALLDSCKLDGVLKEMVTAHLQTFKTELTFQFQHYDNRMHEPLDPLPKRSTAERIESLEIVIADLQERADFQLSFISECTAWPAAQEMNQQYFEYFSTGLKFFQSELVRLKKNLI